MDTQLIVALYNVCVCVYVCVTSFLYCTHVIQRWYIDGTVECFTGSHLVLALLAMLVLTLCVILIIIVIVINTGKLKVCMTRLCIIPSL